MIRDGTVTAFPGKSASSAITTVSFGFAISLGAAISVHSRRRHLHTPRSCPSRPL